LDLEALYRLTEEEQRKIQRFYELLGPRRPLLDTELEELECEVEDFLEYVGLQKSREAFTAAVMRIAALREDLLLQQIAEFDEAKRTQVRERAYEWVSRYYLRRFEALLDRARPHLSTFYAALAGHVHKIGLLMSEWQRHWNAHIQAINRELMRLFGGDEEKVVRTLLAKNLLDRGHGGEVADRCYSVLRIEDDGTIRRLCYAEAFKDEVTAVLEALDAAIAELGKLEDEVWGQDAEWIAYLTAIRDALAVTDPDIAVEAWAEVDRRWMAVTTPIQIGHPLEYYEDRLRKAVALEWDLRIQKPSYPAGERAKKVLAAFGHFYTKLGQKDDRIYRRCAEHIRRTQLYVGRPMLFYGSEFNGLFSAQVVPNDEVVSAELGKKIFAYADMVYDAQRAKPRMRLGEMVYGKELYDHFRRILKEPGIWHRVYDISTIGHEYGHILWMDEDTEVVMNASGQFKNIEEFKATAGGLVSFFLYEEEGLWEYVCEDLLTRAVSLVGWMEVEEVRPYYVEGLIHLAGLFAGGVCSFDGALRVDLSKERYEALKEWYLQRYEELAAHYIAKRDAKEYLERFVEPGGVPMPKDRQVREFVEYYYDLYKKVGAQVA